MYQNMMFGVKRRIISEVQDAFQNHPKFSEKVEVRNRFPYLERIQYGVILRNTSASQIRMSADNYLADIHSHVRLAKQRNSPNTSIEWVRENEPHITEWYTDDISSQMNPTQRLYYTHYEMLAGPGNTAYADNFGQVVVLINGVEISAEAIDGKQKTVILGRAPNSGDTVTISYYKRKLAEPGIYEVVFNSETDFTVFPTYQIIDELLFELTTGVETTVTLQRAPIGPNSQDLFYNFQNQQERDTPMKLIQGVDYSIDYTTGLVTFLSPVLAGYKMTANYYTEVQNGQGPFTFKPYQEVHNAIPGVVICMGRRSVTDDIQLVFVSQDQEKQARVFGGHWEMSLSLGVISKDPIQMEEMTDQLVNWLWGVRKNALEFEGITLNRVEPTGETEEAFIESTGDLYYESSVDISVMSEWQRFVPYIYPIRAFDFRFTMFEPYNNHVIKFPTTSYARVT